ncbi:MAG: hypothetical protein M1817_002512 [Caeruleum heppii]|nr:MAG: hypothetical protein M1817_002512 [Caeruleum heppii]
MAASSDVFRDPLLHQLQRYREAFFNDFPHDIPHHQREELWARQLSSILASGAAQTPTAPRTAPRDIEGSSNLPRQRRRRHYGPSVGSVCGHPSPSHGLDGALVRSSNLSQQSAPAAVPMTRSESMSASELGFDLSADMPPSTSPFGASTSGPSITAWQSYEAPFTPYVATGPESGGLPQVDELGPPGMDPLDYLAGLSHSPTSRVSFSPMSTSPLLGRSNPRRPRRLSNLSAPPMSIPLSLQNSSNQSTAQLTTGTTVASDMSREQSSVGDGVCDGIDMMRFNSMDGISERSTVDYQSGGAKMSPRLMATSYAGNGMSFPDGAQISDVVRGAGGVGQDSTPQTMPTGELAGSFRSSAATESMSRSQSMESSTSNQSARSLRRRREQLANATRPIAPRQQPSETNTSRLGARGTIERSSQTRLRKQTLAQQRIICDSCDPPQAFRDERALRWHSERHHSRRAITKATYVRPPQPRVTCFDCEPPRDFRGGHELQRHADREHSSETRAWYCIDASPDGTFLSNCRKCKSQKKYGASYNAAAHLRRAHFQPRQDGSRDGGGGNRGPRAGIGGGNFPPMNVLRKDWIRFVVVPRDGNHAESVDLAEEEENEPDSMDVDGSHGTPIAQPPSNHDEATPRVSHATPAPSYWPDSIEDQVLEANLLFANTDPFVFDPMDDLQQPSLLDGEGHPHDVFESFLEFDPTTPGLLTQAVVEHDVPFDSQSTYLDAPSFPAPAES